MSTESLTQVWGLHDPANIPGLVAPTATPNVDEMLVNDCLMNRWICHNTAQLLTRIPSSETRLRNEGYIVMYKVFRDLTISARDVAQKRGLTVPSFPDAPTDWQEDVKPDVIATLLPHMAAPVKEHVEFGTAEMKNRHWASMVASDSVLMDMYLGSLEAEKAGSSGSEAMLGTNTPATYTQALVKDKTLAPYTEKLMSKELADCAKVLREEILRIRGTGEAGALGWKEDEAKQLTLGHLKRAAEYFGT